MTIGFGEPFCSVEFHKLDTPVEKPYGTHPGEDYQDQDEITPKEMNDLRQNEGYALSEVMKDMRNIARDVSELKNTVGKYVYTVDKYVSRSDLYMKIFTGSILALVGVVISLVLVRE